MEQCGKLYIVGTPIGNLKDITFRAIETLTNVDLIAAEDTRQTLKLLNHFGIKKTLISYHKFNEQDKSESLINHLKEGNNIALVSDAGMPGISDPGSIIIGKCIRENISFEVIPGASAVITALVYSGLDTTKFLFRGFMPREKKDRERVIKSLQNCTETLVFYEAPHRLINTLEFLKEGFGDRNVVICRELTKLHEEIIRDTLTISINYFKNKPPKGEFVILLEGKSEEQIEQEKISQWESFTIEQHIKKYMDEGYTKKESIKKVSQDRNIAKSEVYRYSISL